MMRLWRCLTALVLALLLTLSVGAAGTAGFSDVPESHWAAQSIRRCAQTGLLQLSLITHLTLPTNSRV